MGSHHIPAVAHLRPPEAASDGYSGQRRRTSFQAGSDLDDMQNLTRNASAISGHREDGKNHHVSTYELRDVQRPEAARTGPSSATQAAAVEFSSNPSTRPPSPNADSENPFPEGDIQPSTRYPEIGTIKSWRGILILIITGGSQLLDNVYMTGVNISLPAIQKEMDVQSGDLQWMISAYTLTFGGFLLLAGVLSDRYGRKHMLCAGLFWITVWSIATSLGTSYIQLTIFRALQGIGAAMTVPSAIGIISSYFVTHERTRALSIYGAAGAIGFCTGLIFGGFLTSSLGWRYLFRLSVVITGGLAIAGFFILPRDRLEGVEKPRLDILGAAVSTTGLILLSFVLSSGGVYGWNKAFIIVLLIGSVVLIVVFTLIEKKVRNPIMPLSLWKIPNFAGLWVSGFVMYGSYQAIIYYLVLISQEVNELSAGDTAVRFLPMGAAGFITSMSMSKVLEKVKAKTLMIVGMLLCVIAPIPGCLISEGDINFWKHTFPSSVISVIGVSIGYCTVTSIMLASVPLNVKSLCGGMVNTAYQIGSGVALALAAAIVQAVDVDKGHGLIKQYSTGLWCCVGLAGIGLLASIFAIKGKSLGISHEDDEPLAMH
ncbi:major facilitator superfamily transporter [Xylona heveae TC161]|uniref:Major facilitator superfamily transporter n=1 Tax=Xylona heveae (strain CBS 132557 / TC161) TaxID=1328760 RepID=A0A161TFK5_XYLHT|nr:major facilitator superfamily transporter [Xylona heveae TC161]KZF24827.1 major facilitator superfamily transporter [Xylona heveae TC161]